MTTPERHALARTLAHLRADPPDDPVLILIAGLAAIGVVVVVSVGLMAAGWVLRGVM